MSQRIYVSLASEVQSNGIYLLWGFCQEKWRTMVGNGKGSNGPQLCFVAHRPRNQRWELVVFIYTNQVLDKFT